MFCAIALSVGIMQLCMFSINSKLRRAIGSPYMTTMISYTVSLVFLTLFMLVTGTFHGPLFGALLREPFWVWLNGVIGVANLTINTLVIGKMGGIKAVILPLITQILGGLLIDGLGLFYSPVIPLSAARIIGALLVIAGVTYASWKKSETGSSATSRQAKIIDLIWICLALFSGALSASMTGIYRYMGSALGSPFRATFVTTVVGCIALGIVCLIPALNRPFMDDRETGKRPIWIYFGGFLGMACAALNVWISQKIGVGMTLVFILLGNTICGGLVDHFGWFGVPRIGFSKRKLVGLIIMMAGAALIRLT